jgi:hypothetical protein
VAVKPLGKYQLGADYQNGKRSCTFENIFYYEKGACAARGVSGNAWDMSRNIRLFGGSVQAAPLAEGTAFQPGDILGLHYALSLYNDRPKPVDYTHVALVVGVSPSKGPLLMHCWRPPEGLFPAGTPRPWPVRLEFLGDLLAGYPGLFEIRELIRPRP